MTSRVTATAELASPVAVSSGRLPVSKAKKTALASREEPRGGVE
jgi:hypothetical protein